MLNNFEKECIAQSRKARLSAAKKKLAKKGEDHNNNDKQRIKNEIKKLETEPLPTQEPDEKVLSALWSLYGLKGEEYSVDERVGLLAIWIEILYGKEVLEDLRLETKVKKIIAKQKRLNEQLCSENKSKSHLAGKNTIDALIYKISESLPEYESDGLVWAETLGLEPWIENDSKDEGDSGDKREVDREDDSEVENKNWIEDWSDELNIEDKSDKLDKRAKNKPFETPGLNIVIICVLFAIGVLSLIRANAPESEEQPKIQANNYVKPGYVKPSYQETVQVFYQKPLAGAGHTLSIPEIRWCVREFTRINAMEEWISGTVEFYDFEADFDIRCGHADFSKEDLDIATREVNAQYNQICTDAIADAKVILQAYQNTNEQNQYSPFYQPENPPALSSQPQQYDSHTSDHTTTLNFDQVIEAKKLLLALGYDPGPITGIYNNPKTIWAVLQYEKNHDKTQDGHLDGSLLADIRNSYLIRPTLKKVKPAQKKRPSNIFSKGSPKQLVIKLQGDSDSVTTHHTYEVLHYGYNSVKVSLKDHKVISWCNASGDLKVNSAKPKQKKQRRRPLNTFNQGSPRQLVIKLQDYPDAVTLYPTYEILHYGYNSVKISLQTNKVINWHNTDGKLKVE
ncbi:peptidoglycan-binding protein [bacterium]|nr:peptidoglycan-binding protein [bacterium]